MSDIVKFLSGEDAKAQDPTLVALDSGQVLFGLERQIDGTFIGKIYYDFFDSKYNVIRRIVMGSGDVQAGSDIATFKIADKEKHTGDSTVVTVGDNATLFLPKHICGEYFAADASFDQNHILLDKGHSYLYGNGLVLINPFEQKQEGWMRIIGANGSQDTTLELATRDSYSKDFKYSTIVARQLDADGNLIIDTDLDADGNVIGQYAREAILLGNKGQSWFPGKVTSARGFIGDLEGHASSATKAQYDWVDNEISETYFADVKTTSQVPKKEYILEFFNGLGSSVKKIYVPAASATEMGLITADTENAQTLTGTKIFDTEGKVIIQAPSGFDYQGIKISGNTKVTPVWFSDLDALGTPVYDSAFGYDSFTKTLHVANVKGLISNAIMDQSDNIIDDHYFCYFYTESKDNSYTLWGMPDSGTRRDFHMDPKGQADKTKPIKIEVPLASEEKAGIITADLKNIQYLAGTKFLKGSFVIHGANNFIGQYYDKTTSSKGYWRLIGNETDDSVTFETLSDKTDKTFGAIYIKQNGKIFELANQYGYSGFYSVKVSDDGTAINNPTNPYFVYLKTTQTFDTSKLLKSVYIDNVINAHTTVFLGTADGDSDALYYINDSDNQSGAPKSSLIIRTGTVMQTFFARLRSLYLDEDLYVGKGIVSDGPIFQHGKTHLHDIEHYHYFTYTSPKADVKTGEWITVDSTNNTAANAAPNILSLGNNLNLSITGNAQGFLRLYGTDTSYAQLYYDNTYFRPNKDIYFTNNNTITTGWANGIRGQVGTNDYWRVGGGAIAGNTGYMELATADDATEQIYVRQYTGVFSTLKRTAALLDENGNTWFPQSIGLNQIKDAQGFYGLSLYGPIEKTTVPSYGMIYRPIGGDTHGYVQDSSTLNRWAVYFNISTNTINNYPYASGWVFKDLNNTQVASINNVGYAQFNMISLNRRYASGAATSPATLHGRISFWDSVGDQRFVWYHYMGDGTVAGSAPTGGQPGTLNNVTKMALRSLVGNEEGQGWIWEAAKNEAVSSSIKPIVWLALSSYDGRLIMKGKEIYYAGSKATTSMIRWLDNAADAYGNGISIGGGGVTIVGAGESATSYYNAVSTAPGTEHLFLTSDNNIYFISRCDTIANAFGMAWTTGEALIPVQYDRQATKNIGYIGTKDSYWSQMNTQWLHVNRANSGTDGGITLYNGESNYAIMFRQTSNLGKHGYVTENWATYFTMSNTENRGWIFRRWGNTNVASINTSGHMALNGRLNLAISWRNLLAAPTAASHAKLFFSNHAHTHIASGAYYIPWFGGMESVTSYGYGNHWTGGLFINGSDTDANGVGFYLGTAWDSNATTDKVWRFTRSGRLHLPGTLYGIDGWFGNHYFTGNWHGWYGSSGNTSSTRYGYIQNDLASGGAMRFMREQGGYFLFNSYIKLPSTPSSWLDGQRYDRAVSFNDATDTGSYWPWMRMRNTASARWFSMGVLNSSLYFIGSSTSRTANGYDYGFVMNFANGTFSIPNTLTASSGWFGNHYLTSNWHGWYAQSGNTSSTRYGYIQNDLSTNGRMRFIREQGGSLATNVAMVFGSDTTPSYTVDVRGNMRTTGRYYSNEWIQFDNWTGLYSPLNGAHFHPNNYTSYGSWCLRGTRNGYYGLVVGPGTQFMHLMDSGEHKGLYEQDQGMWMFYYKRSAATVGIRTSNNSGYAVTIQGDTYVRDGWIRNNGQRGWYNESYGGGIYQTDSTFVRVFNGKAFRCDNEIVSFTPNGFRLSYGSRPVILRNDGADFYILISNNAYPGNNWITPGGGMHPFRINLSNGYIYTSRTYNAVWNDYAEFREAETEEPGRVVSEKGDDTLVVTNERLQHCAGIISDTYGYAEGETKNAKTPIAVAGRVLAYTYQDRDNYHPGDCVCAAPNGTVDIMTRSEIIQYPDRIIGTVSCVPDYDTWGTGNIKVNGRIWIKVK